MTEEEKIYEINTLKNNLTNTDYLLFKYLEGAMSKEEYMPIMAQRQAWRDEINRLEGETPEATALHEPIA